MREEDMTEYEQRARDEILTWRDRKDTRLGRTFNTAVDAVGKLGRFIPPHAAEVLVKAVEGALDGLRDASRNTYSVEYIIRDARARGLDVSRIEALRAQDMEALDQLARRYFSSNKLMAAAEGALVGMGGAMLIPADVPALFGLAFRTIQQIGSAYGFDMSNPAMRPVVLSVLSASSAASSAAKAQVLLDMKVAAAAFATKTTYERVAKISATGAAAKALKKATEHLPRRIALNVTKRKLAQTIPYLGAAVGAGFNYWFLSSTAEAAYMVFRELHLQEKYGS